MSHDIPSETEPQHEQSSQSSNFGKLARLAVGGLALFEGFAAGQLATELPQILTDEGWSSFAGAVVLEAVIIGGGYGGWSFFRRPSTAS